MDIPGDLVPHEDNMDTYEGGLLFNTNRAKSNLWTTQYLFNITDNNKSHDTYWH